MFLAKGTPRHNHCWWVHETKTCRSVCVVGMERSQFLESGFLCVCQSPLSESTHSLLGEMRSAAARTISPEKCGVVSPGAVLWLWLMCRGVSLGALQQSDLCRYAWPGEWHPEKGSGRAPCDWWFLVASLVRWGYICCLGRIKGT